MCDLWLNGSDGTDKIVRLLREYTEKPSLDKDFSFHEPTLTLNKIEVNEEILQAVLDFLRTYQAYFYAERNSSGDLQRNGNCKRGRSEQPQGLRPATLQRLEIHSSPWNPFMEYLMDAVVAMDLFESIFIEGADSDDSLEEQKQILLQQQPEDESDDQADHIQADHLESLTALLPLGTICFRLKFSRQLQELTLVNVLLTKDHVESLMFGLETSRHAGSRLKYLWLWTVLFVDDSDACIHEICEGLPKIATLENLEFQDCRLADHQIALILDAVAGHQGLKFLSFYKNRCRRAGLQALGELLRTNTENVASNQCLCLEGIDLSHQFGDDEVIVTDEERMLLEFLLQSEDHGQQYFYQPLQSLSLCANKLRDADMETIACLIQTFPLLEKLELSENDVTTDGLQLFVKRLQQQLGTSGATRPSRIRTVNLTNNPLSDEASAIFLEIFKILPMLVQIDSNIDWKSSIYAKAIQHIKDINAAGRILLQRTPSATLSTQTVTQHNNTCDRQIALSVWPVVLAPLASKAQRRKYAIDADAQRSAANGLYYLIRHGPIFAGKTDRKDVRVLITSPSRRSPGENNSKKRKSDAALGGHSSLEEYLCNEGAVV